MHGILSLFAVVDRPAWGQQQYGSQSQRCDYLVKFSVVRSQSHLFSPTRRPRVENYTYEIQGSPQGPPLPVLPTLCMRSKSNRWLEQLQNKQKTDSASPLPRNRNTKHINTSKPCSCAACCMASKIDVRGSTYAHLLGGHELCGGLLGGLELLDLLDELLLLGQRHGARLLKPYSTVVPRVCRVTAVSYRGVTAVSYRGVLAQMNRHR